ncbi:tumor necrosis factor a (TNF superfamily, member 2) [Genypterus blacodes]|uniref:tumor necrosis factor a (TNF superfamily, member 2) n=1 Tax=Genypterus blacodes TaxID=154954 RepID=UPI003F7768AB
MTMMKGDCTVLLETDTREETRCTAKSSKLCAALLAITLCLAAAAATVSLLSGHLKENNSVHKDDELHHALRQISGSVRAAIHLEGDYNSERNTLEWKKQLNQYHSQGGLELVQNEIVIPRNGLYFVYSQASFRVSCYGDSDSTSPPMVHLSHTVKRWSSSYGNDSANRSYQIILHSVRTACQRTDSGDPDEQGSWFSTIYMGAVFNLKKGDNLKTVTEERLLPNLDEEPGKTFFGVFAL